MVGPRKAEPEGLKDSPMKKNLVILGGAGQLGRTVHARLGGIALAQHEADLTDRDMLAAALEHYAASAVVNCAAYTQVDRAEQEPEVCWSVNAHGVASLAEICRECDIPLVHISTDYVFGEAPEERRPWREEDEPSPRGVYASSKRAGEIAASAAPRHFIVRTCGLYGSRREDISFVNKMLELAATRDHLRVVADQHCTPTHVADVAEAIAFLLSTDQYGIYHVVNRGHTTWCDFAREIFRLAGKPVTVEAITSDQYPAAAPRPPYSVLDTSKYERLGGPALRTWQEALAAYLRSV